MRHFLIYDLTNITEFLVFLHYSEFFLMKNKNLAINEDNYTH
jgi:hypothetical protein